MGRLLSNRSLDMYRESPSSISATEVISPFVVKALASPKSPSLNKLFFTNMFSGCATITTYDMIQSKINVTIVQYQRVNSQVDDAAHLDIQMNHPLLMNQFKCKKYLSKYFQLAEDIDALTMPPDSYCTTLTRLCWQRIHRSRHHLITERGSA